MADAKVIDLEQAKSARICPPRFHTIAEVDGKIMISIDGTFSSSQARALATALLQRAEAVAWSATPRRLALELAEAVHQIAAECRFRAGEWRRSGRSEMARAFERVERPVRGDL